MEFSNYTLSQKGFFTKSFEVHQHGIIEFYAKQLSFFNNRRFKVYDINNIEIFEIYRTSFFSMFKYEISQNGRVIADIGKKMMSNLFTMNSTEGTYLIDGNLLSSEFKIYKNNEEIGVGSRKVFNIKGKYGFSLIQQKESDLLICFMLTVAIANQLRKQSG